MLALALAAGCVLLGQWQWDRREQRVERNALVTENYDREPASLETVLAADGDSLPANREWTPVRLSGRYLGDEALLLRNRPLDGRPGYHSLVPFATDDGPVLLVDRGWLPTGQTGREPDAVPAPPTGQVDVVARLRPAEPATSRGAPPGQVQRITPASIELPSPAAERLVTGTYGVLATEEPAPPQAPRLLPRPAIDEGPHLSYSLQWFVFALGALVAFVVLARRTAAEDEPVAEDGAGEPSAQQRPRRGRRASAEDEEDALVDAQLAEHRRIVDKERDHGSRLG